MRVISAVGSAVLGLTLLSGASLRAAPSLRPFADYEQTGYVFMPAFDSYGAGPLKREIARHLPDGVTLALYGYSKDPRDREKALDDYRQTLPPDRIIYMTFRRAPSMIWSRDALPLPLVDDDGRLWLVDARYSGGFEPDREVADLLRAQLRSHSLKFSGGNFMANHLGDCFTVESSDTRKMSDAIFREYYGCRSVTRLPRRGGIGHIDERARFVTPTTVLTDTSSYEPVFQAKGFRTVTLPRPRDDRENYVNALIVNGTAFVPQYSRPEDAEAVDVYRRLGFKVVGLDARSLAAKGHGAIHCLTMNYPRVPLS